MKYFSYHVLIPQIQVFLLFSKAPEMCRKYVNIAAVVVALTAFGNLLVVCTLLHYCSFFASSKDWKTAVW